MAAYDVIVVGGGIIGTASAYCLSRRGHKVLVMDQVAIPNPQGSSDDHARMFRLTHGKDSFYTELALRTQPLWKQFQHDTRVELLLQNGMLELAVGPGRYEEASYNVLREMRIPVEKLKPKEVCERYRMLKPRSFRFAVFHPDGGMVWAKKAIETFARGVEKSGGRLEPGVRIAKILRTKAGVQGLRDAKGKTWRAANYVFASGAWTKEILSELGVPMTITQQECLYLRPPRNQGRYRPAHFPVFAVAAKGVHGFPVHIHGFLKMGCHRKGPVKRNPAMPVPPDDGYERKCRAFLKGFIPDLADFADMEGRAHYYTRISDGDFLLDRLPGTPNAWVAAGFGGNGPMFAPLVGRTVSQLVSGEKPGINLHRFRIGRLRLRPEKSWR
ncbi:MAG: FAD-dependent oxidoreductase [Elusimicrobiota bacterium]